jgi:hypothetical protein
MSQIYLVEYLDGGVIQSAAVGEKQRMRRGRDAAKCKG